MPETDLAAAAEDAEDEESPPTAGLGGPGAMGTTGVALLFLGVVDADRTSAVAILPKVGVVGVAPAVAAATEPACTTELFLLADFLTRAVALD